MSVRRFDRRHVLITGAAGGGVGTALAQHFAAGGAMVYVNARTRQEAKSFIDDQPKTLSFMNAGGDIRTPAGVGLATGGDDPHPIDTLICNAATSHARLSVADYSLDQWEDELATILTSALLLCKALLPGMISAGFGRVVMISSNAATRGTWGRGAGYTAAKAGLEGLARQVALECGQYGITANTIAPSQIDTPRARRAGRKTDADFTRYAEALVPVKRVGQVADLCALADYIVSDQAGYLNGQSIALDGGSALSSALSRASGGSI